MRGAFSMVAIAVLATGASCSRPDAGRQDALTASEPFRISTFAEGLPGASAMAIDTLGNMWVSQPPEGRITLLELDAGAVKTAGAIFRDVAEPFGLAMHPQERLTLYYSDRGGVSRVGLYTEDTAARILDLAGSRHIAFGPDLRLYASAGLEIWAVKPDGAGRERIAMRGSQVSSFAWSYVDGQMWIAGPDYVMGGGRRVELPPGCRPGGIGFVPEEGWPEDFWHSLLVACQGSRKVVRIKLDDKGTPLGLEDFITGWSQGRPSGLLIMHGGWMYVSDPEAGKIYRSLTVAAR